FVRVVFFFSSRRRHTSFARDWSSDVCSSDLTLSSNYGIYGPVFELGLNKAYPGKEEYIDSEKYEIKNWDWERDTKVKRLITRINQIRRENPALQSTWDITFHDCDNGHLLCYSKIDQERENKL